VVEGTVRNGVVVPDDVSVLPEGARVGIGIAVADADAELAAEMSAWDHAGEEAWEMLAAWEGSRGTS
jgi:hypothetical protein